MPVLLILVFVPQGLSHFMHGAIQALAQCFVTATHAKLKFLHVKPDIFQGIESAQSPLQDQSFDGLLHLLIVLLWPCRTDLVGVRIVGHDKSRIHNVLFNLCTA